MKSKHLACTVLMSLIMSPVFASPSTDSRQNSSNPDLSATSSTLEASNPAASVSNSSAGQQERVQRGLTEPAQKASKAVKNAINNSEHRLDEKLSKDKNFSLEQSNRSQTHGSNVSSLNLASMHETKGEVKAAIKEEVKEHREEMKEMHKEHKEAMKAEHEKMKAEHEAKRKEMEEKHEAFKNEMKAKRDELKAKHEAAKEAKDAVAK